MKRLLHLSVYLLLLLLALLGSGCDNGSTSGGPTGLGHTGEVHPRIKSGDLLNYDKSIPEILGTSEVDKDKVSLLIEKSQYRLTVLYDGEPIKQYPVVFGGNIEDDKLMQGDGCVPEGIFRVQDLYPHSNWSKFIWIDYPNEESWRKHNQAKQEGWIPEDAGIGGEIGIHGGSEGEDFLIEEGTNWTGGCTAMKRADVDDVYSIVQVGTIVETIR